MFVLEKPRQLLPALPYLPTSLWVAGQRNFIHYLN